MKHRSGIISINVWDRDSREIVNILSQEYGIATQGSLHCAPLAHKTIGTKEQGTVRFSPGISIPWMRSRHVSGLSVRLATKLKPAAYKASGF